MLILDELRNHNEIPETTEKQNLEEETDTLDAILWNTHGGHLYHLIQCL